MLHVIDYGKTSNDISNYETTPLPGPETLVDHPFTLQRLCPSFHRDAHTAIPAQTATPSPLPGPSFTNPVYNRDFPDPHIILVREWIQELTADGLNLVGEPRKLLNGDQSWELPLIENPAMLEHTDTYYLSYLNINDT